MRYSEIKAVENASDWRRAQALTDARSMAGTARWPWTGILIVLGFAVLLMGCSSAQYRDTSVAISTTGQVDLDRYQGKWFEIARFPNRFEEGCFGVTAEYSINDDGSVKVINTCRQGALDGPVEIAEGVATKQRDEGDRLDVTFVPWLPFARGDYWILDLDDDYQVVVVGNPAGTTGWVLARTPTLPQTRLQAAYDVLTRNGYDISQITLTPQVP